MAPTKAPSRSPLQAVAVLAFVNQLVVQGATHQLPTMVRSSPVVHIAVPTSTHIQLAPSPVALRNHSLGCALPS